MAAPTRRIGCEPLSLPELLALARGALAPVLDDAPAHRARLEASLRAVADRRASGAAVYGVTTGVGASVANSIPTTLQEELPNLLLRFHGCGTGAPLAEAEAAAVLAVRLASLARVHSGVRPALLERLCTLLRERLLPRIPEEGSVGASGDLTPLSYLAALVVGEREATLRGRPLPAAEGLAALGLAPLALLPKESLALMNGTSVMTALGVLAWERALQLARAACALTALVSEATRGNPEHFDARIAAWKPHPGQVRAAAWIREDLGEEAAARSRARLQDRYSVRCAPQVIGVLLDAAAFTRGVLETEANGANDNPLVDPDTGEILHGGNFYGGHVAFALDGLKAAVAGVADLLDRQLVLLCTPETSGGLPANLVGAEGAAAVVHHGFKAMQIGASALAAEAAKLTMPAAAFSRSTESHNQDKVSMGTIAARDARRILELAETTAAIALLAACQAVDLRERLEPEVPLGPRARVLRDAVRKAVPHLAADRRQDLDIARVLELWRGGALPAGRVAELDPVAGP